MENMEVNRWKAVAGRWKGWNLSGIDDNETREIAKMLNGFINSVKRNQ